MAADSIGRLAPAQPAVPGAGMGIDIAFSRGDSHITLPEQGASDVMTSSAQQTAMAFVEARKSDLSAWTRHIFDLGETPLREYESAAWYVDRLRREGFTVEEGSGAMPTAFA